jgi:hypothetical protein
MIRALALLLLLSAPQERRRIPPPGVPVPPADRAELESGLRELRAAIDALPAGDLVADAEIYHKAVDWALRYDEILNVREIPLAQELLKTGLERARLLKEGKAPWAEAAGLIPRAYVSGIDGSVQPYGLVVPPTFKRGADHAHRLDVWLHGRSETLTELNFLSQRGRQAGEFTPPDTIVLHVYGRFCNAFKFAGEGDVFQAIASVRKRYPVDPKRILVRGFSMGGAGCWHLAVHHSGFWAAAAPGAGFAETPIYANVARDPVKPTWYQEKLWHLYDATDCAANLFNLPTVAYSGELDKQKQAADIMGEAMKKEGLELVHIIGPKTEHRYEPEAKKEVARRIDEIAARGRDLSPKKVRFTTWTLKYNECLWVTIDQMEEHWARARLDAEQEGDGKVVATTTNVAAFSLGIPVARAVIDGQEVAGGPRFLKVGGRWTAGEPDPGLRKRGGLQGPIDDAFTGRFLVVRPTRQPMHPMIQAWVSSSMGSALEHWRRIFRGEARVKDDAAVTDEDIASSHLVLWGDPGANAVLARIADRLPLRWNAKGVAAGGKTWSDSHVPVLVYPNPLNPKRYVVLNSGFTFQAQSHLSNARQVPMLPDWAVIDVLSGKVADANFFGERWELKP